MENALLIGLSRQIALGRELDVIANNVANVTTNGFKSRSTRFEEFISPKATGDTFPRADRRISYVIDKGTPLDLSPGAMERTGNPLDVAIKGDAFFVVRTPAGDRFTRNGSFEINGRGELVTSDGHAVQGENGPITFSSNESGAQIAPDGTVTTAQGQRGKVRLVTFANAQSLRNEGSNVFSSPQAPQPAGNRGQLVQGVVERSNVKPVLEMSRLVEVNRAYTSIASMMSKQDELRRAAIQRLADVGNT